MKKTDKFMIGILVGLGLLIVAAFAVALGKPKADYAAEDTPEGVAFNYLFAIQRQDDARAYGYLSPSIEGYPESLGDFSKDIRDNEWQFGGRGNGSVSVDVVSTEIIDDRAFVEVGTSEFYERDLFSSGVYTGSFDMILELDSNGVWKIVDSNSYWYWCWSEPASSNCN